MRDFRIEAKADRPEEANRNTASDAFGSVKRETGNGTSDPPPRPPGGAGDPPPSGQSKK